MTNNLCSSYISRTTIATLTLFLTLGLMTGLAAADEHDGVLTVDDDFEEPGEYEYDSIQDAVDDAETGYTIEVENGTYNEQVILKRSEISDIIIEGAEGASERPLVYDESESGEPTFAVDTDEVTIEGLEIKRNDSSSSNVGQAVRIAGDNIVLNDNFYSVDTSEDAAISVLTDSSAAAGNPEFNKDITSVDIVSGEITAEGSSTSGLLIANTSGDNEITENAVSVDDVTFADAEGAHFVELNSSVSTFDVAETLSDNSFTNAAGVSKASELISGDWNVTSKISSTVQGAVDVADEGASAEVTEGTYEEGQITVDKKDVSIVTQGDRDNTVIKNNQNDTSEAVQIRESGVKLEGFTVERKSSDNSPSQGIGVRNTSTDGNQVEVINNKVVGDSDNEDEESSNFGIYIANDDDANVTNVSVRDNSVANFSVGTYITVDQDRTVADIEVQDNELESNAYGVFMSSFRDGGTDSHQGIVVENNEIRDNDLYGVQIPGADEDFFGATKNDIDLEGITINQNEIVSNSEGGVNVSGTNTLDAEQNYWGAASGPEGSGANVVGAVDFEPWLLEADGTEYEETVSLTGGDWSLISAPGTVDASSVVVDNGSDAKLVVYDTEASEFDPVDSVDSNPLGATFVHVDDAAGLGLSYSDSTSASKDVVEGWNMIGSSQEIKLRDALSPIANSLNSFFAPAEFNDGKLGGTYIDLGDRSSEVVDASSLDYLQGEFGESQEVSKYDGYWVKASDSSTLELTVPQPE